MTQDRSLVQIALYAAIIAVLGLLPKFNIPLAGGVPITAQSLGIMLAGVMLGPVRGALAVVLFLVVVALGAPLLAGGRGGIGVFTTASVGFLLGWPIAAFVTGLLMQKLKAMSILPAAFIASIVGGIIVLYAIGIPGVAWKANLTLTQAAIGSMVFIPGDIVKAVLVAIIAKTIYAARPSAVLSRA